MPFHEWFIEFENEPEDFNAFSDLIDQSLQEQNSYYKDLIVGNVLQPLKVTRIKTEGFKKLYEVYREIGRTK